jgi:hypothetical protein
MQASFGLHFTQNGLARADWPDRQDALAQKVTEQIKDRITRVIRPKFCVQMPEDCLGLLTLATLGLNQGLEHHRNRSFPLPGQSKPSLLRGPQPIEILRCRIRLKAQKLLPEKAAKVGCRIKPVIGQPMESPRA